MMAALIEDAAARADLEAILEGVAMKYGLRMALDVADVVRTAALEGRMDGRNYVACDRGEPDEQQRVCVVGHIALALDSFEDGDSDVPVVPAWNYHDAGISPIEEHVAGVRPGDTPDTSPYLATLVSWVSEWERARRV